MDLLGISLQGMNQAQGQLEKTAARVAQAPAPQAGDSVDLSDQMVSLLTARNDFQANAATEHTANEMTKATLDLLA